jgi:hypothetical protein
MLGSYGEGPSLTGFMPGWPGTVGCPSIVGAVRFPMKIFLNKNILWESHGISQTISSYKAVFISFFIILKNNSN